jgi:lysophospholipase L1-like esterase
MIDSLNPKLWFISIGSNDLFEEKCTDRFVVASILNVVKAISDRKPDAHFIIHGILPRKDEAKSKTDFLKKKWKYAQMINTQIRKFCEHSPKLFYMQAGPLFLKEASKDWRGRRSIDHLLLEDGVYPTKRGMEVWGDYIVKRVKQILKDIQAQETNGIKGVSRRLQIAATANSTKNGTMPTPNLQLER